MTPKGIKGIVVGECIMLEHTRRVWTRQKHTVRTIKLWNSVLHKLLACMCICVCVSFSLSFLFDVCTRVSYYLQFVFIFLQFKLFHPIPWSPFASGFTLSVCLCIIHTHTIHTVRLTLIVMMSFKWHFISFPKIRNIIVGGWTPLPSRSIFISLLALFLSLCI